MKKAVFFDRDGTLIRSVHYLNKPEQVELVEGAAQVLREIEQQGFLRIVVTNQAAINKGLLTESGLNEIHCRLAELLSKQDASIDAWYHCPEVRSSDNLEIIEHPDRKPGPGMLLRAASDLGLTLGESWMVGDAISDALAGHNAGCRASILIDSGLYKPEYREHPGVDYVVGSIEKVTGIIFQQGGLANG